MNPADSTSYRVLIVDDHEVTRLGLATLLRTSPMLEVCGEAGSVARAKELLLSLRPDVVLLDLRLRDGTGLDVCQFIRHHSLGCRILVLTSYAEDELVLGAIDAGANGYLLKEVNGEALIRALVDVAAGKSVLDPAITNLVLRRVRPTPAPVQDDRIALLSSQQRRVVALVAEGKTNKEIGQELGLSPKTVKNYLSNAMEKLGLARRSQAAALFVKESHGLP